MATIYTWHSGKGGLNCNWVAHAPLLPDEIISSWLVRAALIQGCDPLQFTGFYWPKWRVWSSDVDRFIDKILLEAVIEDSGIPWLAFRQSMLRPLIQKTIRTRLPQHAVWPWVLATGTRNRKRRGGMQYCPACLAEDKTPYYRLQWRLSWHTCCSKHHIQLLDRCWSCNSSIEPHRVTFEGGSVCLCSTCKSDLRQTDSLNVPEGEVSFQVLMDDKLSAKGTVLKATETKAWFLKARAVLSLLRYAGNHPTGTLAYEFSTLGVDVPALAPANGLQFELKPTLSRLPFLDGLSRTMTTINSNCGKLSIVLDGLIQKEANLMSSKKKKKTRSKRRAPAEHPLAKAEFEPKSKKAVQRQWALFLRRYDLG